MGKGGPGPLLPPPFLRPCPHEKSRNISSHQTNICG